MALVSGETYNIEDNNEKNKDKNVSWKRYDYVIKKSTFENEAAYSLLITTIDVAGNESFSNINSPKYKDSRQAEVEFVVDRTIPDVVVNNLEGGGHYNVESKEVEIIANDDNRLQKVVLTLNGEQIAAEIEAELQNDMVQEITSRDLGERIMIKLKQRDDVAYVRFASVYREFKDVDTFLAELKALMDNR